MSEPKGLDSRPRTERRWCVPMPRCLVLALFAVEGLLMLCEWLGWFGFSEHPGLSVLIALVVVGATAVLFLVWSVASLLSRRRFQFGLRLLLLFVLAASVACSWLALEMKSERSQWKAAKAIKGAGGIAVTKLTCLGRLLRDDSLVTVPGVNLIGKPVTDADLVGFQCLKQVSSLSLDRTQLTDGGLVHLQGLCQLRSLSLDNTQITDRGLVHLRRLSHLSDLSLCNTNITDAGLVNFEGLLHLNALWLNGTHVTDGGLVHFRGLHELADLHLTRTRVTDEGAKELNQVLPACEIWCDQGKKQGSESKGGGSFQKRIPQNDRSSKNTEL
jgi:hypothetical protein